ncbi:MAG: CoA-binding protein [Deltaproteobacteria bacterium]|nr:CoA-binding protein [Deltaproteobacteria bacterium]
MKNLEYFFRPGSIAIVGASDQAMRPGNILINNLVRFNYKGKIYPVNPKCNPVLGNWFFPCWGLTAILHCLRNVRGNG